MHSGVASHADEVVWFWRDAAPNTWSPLKLAPFNCRVWHVVLQHAGLTWWGAGAGNVGQVDKQQRVSNICYRFAHTLRAFLSHMFPLRMSYHSLTHIGNRSGPSKFYFLDTLQRKDYGARSGHDCFWRQRAGRLRSGLGSSCLRIAQCCKACPGLNMSM